jgi:outer membrane lipoprotein-sorting protein
MPDTVTEDRTGRTLPLKPMRVHRRGFTRLVAHAAVPVCAAGLFPALSVVRAQQTPAAKPTFDDLYRQGRQITAGIATLTARFTETTTSTLLERPIVERGVLFMERSVPRVALRYSDPQDRVLLIDGDRMTTSWPSRGISQTTDIRATRRRIQGYFEDADASELRKAFTITLRDTSERAGAHEVTLVPSRRQISEALARLELWVNERAALLEAMRMTFANGDVKLMEFADVDPHATIDPRVFSVPR